MPTIHSFSRLRSFVLFVLIATSVLSIAQTAPVVHKVEPPNWWTGMHQQLMLLIYGDNLSDAKVTTRYKGVKVVRVESPNPTHLFVYLDISEKAAPGTVDLQLRTKATNHVIAYPLGKRDTALPERQGLTPNDVIYLIMPDRFADGDRSNDPPSDSPNSFDRSAARAYHGGDLRGIKEHLAYLKDLGVTTVWITPVYQNDKNSRDYHGYGAVDFYAVDSHLGSMQDLRDLVRAAHETGLKMVLDVVVNHTGPAIPWAKDPPLPNWLHGTPQHHLKSEGSFDSITSPHSVPIQSEAVLKGWFADLLPDIDQETPEVQQYLIQNNIWWIESAGFDGLRLDTFPYSTRRFWQAWHKALQTEYPKLFTVGEVYNDDYTITSFFQGGRSQYDGIDTRVTSVFDFPLGDAIRKVSLQHAPMKTVSDVLQRDWLYPHPEMLVPFVGNHDMPRVLSRPGADDRRARLAYSLLLTMRGIPQLYYGDEIAMTGNDDPDNRHDYPGGFPSDAHNAFNRTERSEREQKMFDHVNELLKLRAEHAALRTGDLKVLATTQNTLAYLRTQGGDRVLVLANNATEPASAEIDLTGTSAANVNGRLQCQDGSSPDVQGQKLHAQIAPESAVVCLVP